jgi:tetratricopeptide (TPR) repeat protein
MSFALSPQNEEAIANIIDALFFMDRKPEEAIALGEQHWAGGVNVKISRTLAKCYIKSGQPDKARLCYEAARQYHPDNTKLLYESGRLELEKDNLDAAKSFFTHLAYVNPNHEMAKLYIAYIDLKEGDTRGCIDKLHAMVKEGYSIGSLRMLRTLAANGFGCDRYRNLLKTVLPIVPEEESWALHIKVFIPSKDGQEVPPQIMTELKSTIRKRAADITESLKNGDGQEARIDMSRIDFSAAEETPRAR